MEPFIAAPANEIPTRRWAAYPLISANKFAILSVLSMGLYGLWWQYKTWRFFKQWRQTEEWPTARAIFSLFTFHELLRRINEFAYANGEYTPLPNVTGLAAGYVVLNLCGRLPDPFWLVALGAIGFVVPAYRAFREAMLDAPAYGGRNQKSFSGRQVAALVVALIAWGLVFIGFMLPEA
jgi:hypothetical protein